MSNRLRPLGATLASLAAMLLAGCATQQISWGGLSGSEPPPAAQPAGALSAREHSGGRPGRALGLGRLSQG